MYEDQTQEIIQDRTLARVSNLLDKREGSLIQTAVGASCAELAQMYIALDIVLDESFADTQSRDYLIRRAAERGLSPIPASACIVRGVFNLDSIPIGTRFYCGEYAYTATERIESKKYKLMCETEGAAPNGTTGQLIPITTVPGLTEAEIDMILAYGADEEDTETFRQRYFDSFQSKTFSGNRADYKAKTLSIPGVGAVKVYRASSVAGDEGTSGGNVRLVILDSQFGVPSQTVVDLVKNTLDPEGESGYGYGLAPMWHHVYVEAATGTAININVSFTFEEGIEYEDVEEQVKQALDAYYLSLAKSWSEDTTGLIVRKTYIQNALIDIDGIVDAVVNTINGSVFNLTLGEDAIPIRGAIT